MARDLRPLARALLLALPRALLVAAIVPAFPAACGEPAPTPPPAPAAAPIPAESEFLAAIDRTRGEKDCFEVLREPPFVAVADAPRMSDDEIVLGLALGAEQVCYPVQYLNAHEIAEHRMAGLELLACW